MISLLNFFYGNTFFVALNSYGTIRALTSRIKASNKVIGLSSLLIIGIKLFINFKKKKKIFENSNNFYVKHWFHDYLTLKYRLLNDHHLSEILLSDFQLPIFDNNL